MSDVLCCYRFDHPKPVMTSAALTEVYFMRVKDVSVVWIVIVTLTLLNAVINNILCTALSLTFFWNLKSQHFRRFWLFRSLSIRPLSCRLKKDWYYASIVIAIDRTHWELSQTQLIPFIEVILTEIWRKKWIIDKLCPSRVYSIAKRSSNQADYTSNR